MVNSQEIIERSIYSALLSIAVAYNYSLDPVNYLPATVDTKAQYNLDKKTLIGTGNPYIGIYGAGNNQSRGMKEVPRITIEPQGFFPGDIGFPKQSLDKSEDGTAYLLSESSQTETIHQVIDIHLVSNNISDMRVMHNILNSALPTKGYIKPYTFDVAPPDGNIFLELSNFFNQPDTDKGIIEKVYQFTVKDTLLSELFNVVDTITPISDISVLIDNMKALHIN